MARWLIQLVGSAEDLEEFTAWFPNGPVYAVADGHSVFLTGNRLEQCPGASEAVELATEALDALYAVISLLSSSTKRPMIGSVFREDGAGNRQEHHLLTCEIVISLRGRVRGCGVRPTQAQQLLSGSHRSARLRNALLLWADPLRTWPRLFRILEELELHHGMPVHKASLCTADKRKTFRRSANVAEVAGKDSRHAAGVFQPPPSPMSLRDATSFISTLLTVTLRKAAGC